LTTFVLILGLLFVASPASGQKTTKWDCGFLKQVKVSIQGDAARSISVLEVPPKPMQHLKGDSEVTVEFAVSKKGEVECAHIVGGNPMLFGVTLDAIKQWRFQRYLLNGEEVSYKSKVVFRFHDGVAQGSFYNSNLKKNSGLTDGNKEGWSSGLRANGLGHRASLCDGRI